MRKIQSKEELARANRRKQLLIGGIMIGLLVLSTAGYALFSAFDEESSTVEEGGVTFIPGQGGWIAQVNGLEYGFRFLPSEVADVSVQGNFDISEYNPQTVLYFTDTNSELVSEIIPNIGRHILRFQGACINGSASCDGNVPVKACDSNVFNYNPSNETRVVRQSNCVQFYGDPVRAADAFLYKLLKIS